MKTVISKYKNNDTEIFIYDNEIVSNNMCEKKIFLK